MQTPIERTARFTAMPDDETLATTVAALEARGFGTEVVEDLDAARGPSSRASPTALGCDQLLGGYALGSYIGKILEIH